MSTSGRETLVKTVLSSIPIYHFTVFQAQKGVLKRIDRLRRSFLWRGETPENVTGGHSLINWPTTCLPKEKGGIGIMDLERFTRALRLRWLWFKWKQKERAWTNLEVPCNKTDHELFNASTVVNIGNGKTALFWTSSWINGASAKTIAPSLFQKTHRKKISVQKALENNRWIDHIYPPNSHAEVSEFADLWEAIKDTQLINNMEDDIRWRWTESGEYTTKSAYEIQFQGTFSKLRIMPIWKAKTEPKCRFFAWTLMHKKILTANNLMKRGWTDDPICKLCTNDQETPTHLCKDCPFTKEVWELIKIWFSLTDLSSISTTGSLHNYWRRCRRKVDKNQRRRFDGIIIYFWWNIWKERNRRTFQQKSLSPKQVASLCKDDISQFSLATSPIHNTAN